MRGRDLESDPLSQGTVSFILRHEHFAALAFEFADERASSGREAFSTTG